MTNTVLNPSVIAKMAIRILDNELVMAKRVHRAYEDEFTKKVNGYDVGDTISIRKPGQFTVRNGAVAAIQDHTEGKLTLSVNKQKGVDFAFTSAELTLKIEELADRVIKPAMVQLANQVDRDLMDLYVNVANWVGQPATGADATVDSFAEFARGAERLDEMAVPQSDRSAVLAPSSYWSLAGSQTALFMQSIGNQAYREGEIGKIGSVATYMSQNTPTLVLGTGADAAALVNGAAQNVTYATVKDSESMPAQQTLITDTWGASATIAAGTVFTIAGVFAVNPVTKVTLGFLQHFTVLSAVTADGAGNATLTIAPAIITSGAFQTVSAVPADNAALVVAGAASGAYRQNLMFHKNAFALAVVPMVRPPGAVDVARESYKGLSARLIPYYDGTNDISNYRLDILYGVKCVDQRLATRFSGGTGTI
jgi:P22 coat protein - gene protein 5